MNNSKPVKLKIDWCTHEAAKYACENWHYSKKVPSNKLSKIGVWEDGIFVGCVIFSPGPSPNIWKTFKLSPIQGAELSRVALKSHRTPVSKIISISLKFIKKNYPGLKLIISYADKEQNHHGGIYQAGNWLYLGEHGPKFKRAYKSGKIIHERNMRQRIIDGKSKRSDFLDIPVLPKHKYAMPLDDCIRKIIEPLIKPYPKRVGSKAIVASGFQSEEGGETPTPALQLNEDDNGQA